MCQREGRTGVRLGKLFGVSEGGRTGVNVGKILGFDGEEVPGQGRIATGWAP